MESQEIEMADVIVVLDDLDDAQTLAIVEQLKAVGLSVASIDNDNSVVEGSLPLAKVHDLQKVQCVRYVRNVFTYTSGPPSVDFQEEEE